MEKNYDPLKIEKAMQELWQQDRTYCFDPKSPKPIYSIDTPPPTVSGSLHIGHIFSYTQAEMIARFKRMEGYNVFYPFGFDDNGLPTERLIEKEEGIFAKDLPRSEFGKRCTARAQKYEQEFREMWKSLGFSVDWSLQYETNSPRVQKISQRSFIELFEAGKAYMKESPVLWCTECQTSIAQAELELSEQETTFNYLPFYTEGGVLQVATTRPELLYGCVCLFVHPEDERYQGYIGKYAKVPLYDYEIPILAEETVSMTKGTGVVMCATFGDSTDVEWYQKHDLPYRKVILGSGTLAPEVPFIGGLKIIAARKQMIEMLKEQGLLLKSEPMTHQVAVHERCGKTVEILPSKQWYIDILTDKAKYLEAADQIEWYPASMKQRYLLWVENLKWDWCISRQRYYGVPFPIWYCEACGEVRVATEEELPINPLETLPKTPCSCGCSHWIPENAVLDTWATSSVTPQINARWGEEGDISNQLLPMSLRTQAHEIIRTWAFYTIVKSLYHTGQIPWKDIMISGFVLAKKGEKISKSKNNGSLSPTALIEAQSADAIRYWAANSKLGTDTFFAIEDLAPSKRLLTKLWNAGKFALSHLEDYQPGEVIELKPVDRWIIERYRQTTMEVTTLLNHYEIGSARHEIDEFFWKDFCDYYLEIVKERLYQPEKHGEEARKSAQYALYTCLLGILKLYGIYIPHMTECIYQEYFKAFEKHSSLHRLTIEKITTIDETLLDFGQKLKEIIGGARKYKSEKNLSMKDEMEILMIPTTEATEKWFKETAMDITACCRAKALQYQ